MYRILWNKSYYGHYEFKGTVNENFFPALITKEQLIDILKILYLCNDSIDAEMKKIFSSKKIGDDINLAPYQTKGNCFYDILKCVGELDGINIRLDGRGSEFPIFEDETSSSSDPLWSLKVDCDEPASSSFYDCFQLYLNIHNIALQ